MNENKNQEAKVIKNERPIVVGLDIGTTKIVAIAGFKNEFGKIEILGYGRADSYGVETGTVLNVLDCTRAIENALKDFRVKCPDLDFSEVYVGVAGKHITSSQITGSRVRTNDDILINQNDIQELINMLQKTHESATEVIIDIVPQEFIIDDKEITTKPIGYLGTKITANFHMVQAEVAPVRTVNMATRDADISIIDLVLQPLASAAAVLTAEDLEEGVCMVDIGGGTTDVAIFYNNVLYHTAVIPEAGVALTSDIKNSLGISFENAEIIKQRFGKAIVNKELSTKSIRIPLKASEQSGVPKVVNRYVLAQLINARMKSIFQKIKMQLDVLEIGDKLHGGVIITGGGSQLADIDKLAMLELGLNVRIGKPNVNLGGEVPVELNNPKYATCIGLIMRGLADYELNKFHDQIDTTTYSGFVKAKEAYSQHEELQSDKVSGLSDEDVPRSGLFKSLFGTKAKNEVSSKLTDSDFEAEEELTTKATRSPLLDAASSVFRTLKMSLLDIVKADEEDREL